MREALRPLTDLLEHLAIALRDAETWAHQAAAADPVTRRLMTAPGVGPVTALSYAPHSIAWTDFPTRVG